MLAPDVHRMIEQHEKCALLFSGGKDSLACLHLLRPFWPKLFVVWVNTQAVLPEQLNFMASVAKLVPHFVEVDSNQPEHLALFGLPSDVVPLRSTLLGTQITQARPVNGVLVQSSVECCTANLWYPAAIALQKLGATLVITGQRNDDKRKSLALHGAQAGGLTYCYPVRDWTAKQTVDFLTLIDVALPAYYTMGRHSLDCWSCTAYLDESAGRMRYLRENYPDKFQAVKSGIMAVLDAVKAESMHMENLANYE